MNDEGSMRGLTKKDWDEWLKDMATCPKLELEKAEEQPIVLSCGPTGILETIERGISMETERRYAYSTKEIEKINQSNRLKLFNKTNMEDLKSTLSTEEHEAYMAEKNASNELLKEPFKKNRLPQMAKSPKKVTKEKRAKKRMQKASRKRKR